jgi:phage N-6-adenine-methyltransferase
LMALAHDFQLAVNLIRHPTKCGNNPLHRGLGGVAVINVARAALVVGRNPSSEDPFQHVLAFNRGNLPRTRDRSLIYRTVRRGDAIVIEWLGESSYSANDIVAAAHNADTQSQLQEACYVLYSALAAHEGPMAATQVDAAAQAALVSVGTLKRAKNVLKVRSRRELDRTPTMAGGPTKARWLWELPADEDLLRPYRERFEREQQEETTPEITDDHDAKTKDRGTGKNGTAVNSPEKKDNGGASTPQWLFDRCNQLAIQACGEPITLDVAAAEWNHKCDRYFTEADDGLKQEWDAKAVWCNPPFLATTVESFVRKALEAAQHGTTTLLLIPWWNYPYLDLCERHGRIHRICSPVSFQRQDCTTLTMNNGFRSTSLVVVVFGPTVRPGCGTPIRKGDTFADNIDTKVGSAGDQPVTEVQDTPAKSMPAAPAVRPPQDPPLPEMVTNG